MGIYAVKTMYGTSFVIGDDIKHENDFVSIHRDNQTVALIKEDILEYTIYFDSAERIDKYYNCK